MDDGTPSVHLPGVRITGEKIKNATCKAWKDPEEFNWRNKALGIRHVTCRECHKPFRKNWYEDNKNEYSGFTLSNKRSLEE